MALVNEAGNFPECCHLFEAEQFIGGLRLCCFGHTIHSVLVVGPWGISQLTVDTCGVNIEVATCCTQGSNVVDG